MTTIGIDYSITSPAICIYEGEPEKFSFKSCHIYSLSDHDIASRDNLHFHVHSPFNSQTERFDNISDWAINIIDEYDPNDVDCIGIEDYAMAAKGRVFNIAENTGILKHKLWTRGFYFITIPPTVIKKDATTKGNAKKEQMVDQFKQDTKIDLKKRLQPNRKLGSPTTDIVDAYYICKYTIQAVARGDV